MATRRRQTSLPGMEESSSPLDTPAVDKSLPGAPAVAEPPPPPRAEQPIDEPQGPPSLAGKVVYVIDANSLIFQVFHAIPEMTSPRGEPVNAVYGFTRDLLFLLEKKRPDYLFSAHDPPGPTFRHELYEPYKAQRSEMPDALRPQMPKIQQVLQALGIPALRGAIVRGGRSVGNGRPSGRDTRRRMRGDYRR